MKKYITPNTIVLRVTTQTIICTSEPTPTSTGGNPADARAPQRAGSLYL